MSEFDTENRGEIVVSLVLIAFALGVLGGLIVMGERVFGAAW